MSPDFSSKKKRYAEDAPAWWTTDEWETPPAFVDQLEAEFGRFTLDPCARAETAKAEEYYSKEDNGLVQPWDGRVYVNPPYSDPGPWVQKAIDEVAFGQVEHILLLLPAATDTGWFHDLVLARCNIRFLRGRLRFLGWDGKPAGSPQAGNVLAKLPRIVGDGRFHL
jgi:phage N-6-adenine-methyltransferase